MDKKQLSLGGVAAAVTFIGMLILFSTLTPGYNHLTQAVSELGMLNASYALLWNFLGFGLVGALIFVLH